MCDDLLDVVDCINVLPWLLLLTFDMIQCLINVLRVLLNHFILLHVFKIHQLLFVFGSSEGAVISGYQLMIHSLIGDIEWE